MPPLLHTKVTALYCNGTKICSHIFKTVLLCTAIHVGTHTQVEKVKTER